MSVHFYVGTSGYSYKAWKGSFYPKGLPDKEMLEFYGSQFRTVEINNTFYRMPKAAVLRTWAAAVPADFKFVLKASQRITHMQRLKNSEDSLGYLLEVAGALEDRLGPLLFQLPPNLKKDLARLGDFLALLPRDRRAAMEFRHQSWFDDEVFELLRQHRAALCIAEPEEGVETPFVSTADWGYLRLRRPDYTDAELAAWARRVGDQPLRLLQARGRRQGPRNGEALSRTGDVRTSAYRQVTVEYRRPAADGPGQLPEPGGSCRCAHQPAQKLAISCGSTARCLARE